jgi:hypothetical protein
MRRKEGHQMPQDESRTIVMHQIEPGQTVPSPPEDEAHLYPIRHESARRWVDLTLHQTDLQTTLGWLELLIHRHTQPTPEAHALWTAALVTFFKCFQRSKNRVELDAKVVFANEPEEGRAEFSVLRALRDKTVVHDENSYTQGTVVMSVSNPGGPVARAGKPYVISFHASTLDDAHISNLRLLTLASIAYVNAAAVEVSAEVEAYVRSASRADIVASGPYTYTAPSPDTAHKSR